MLAPIYASVIGAVRCQKEEEMAEEKNLENQVKRYLQDEGCWYIKYWAGGGPTKSGIPDLLVCCDGIFLGVELKAKKGKPTDLQLRQLHRIRDSGGLAILLFPKDLELFKNLIRGIKAEKYVMVRAIMEVFEERMKEYE